MAGGPLKIDTNPFIELSGHGCTVEKKIKNTLQTHYGCCVHTCYVANINSDSIKYVPQFNIKTKSKTKRHYLICTLQVSSAVQ